jgi:hypothetical protein
LRGQWDEKKQKIRKHAISVKFDKIVDGSSRENRLTRAYRFDKTNCLGTVPWSADANRVRVT